MRLADERITSYLKDDVLLQQLSDELSGAARLRSIIVDITQACNIRCKGCYFFEEKMDQYKRPKDEADFDDFIAREKARGTNYMTVVGGEPALMLGRLMKLHQNFRVMPSTNGLKKIPVEGFEGMPISVSVWGGHETDRMLRGSDRIDIFAKALQHYRNDPRVTWYYTTTPGNSGEIESVTEEIVNNGNSILFSYYEDHSKLGGRFGQDKGFRQVRAEIDRMIERFPDRILTSSYINKVGTTNELLGDKWGYDVCPTIDAENPKNLERTQNGNPYVPHFRAFYSDLKTTRRCCVGEAHDCGSCSNVYAKMTWINVNQERHLENKDLYFNWLSSKYIGYLFIRAVDINKGRILLPQIHDRHRRLREESRLDASTAQA